jgi:hypothetical protein
LVVSVATLIDLWYVSQTTQSVTAEQLGRSEAQGKSAHIDG